MNAANLPLAGVASHRTVTAVLGPTNTGKTHLAIERMLGHQSGMIGLPLRLLAREVYDRVKSKVGAEAVALITGEEKIKPAHPRYWVCTVEAMPRDLETEFVAIDEIQLAADPDRGHVFTERLLNARGTEETLMLGATTIRDVMSAILPGANFITRPRLSKLSYSGEKKISRLPRRSAIVAFSASEVYTIAELVRRQRGGAAVVLGALSPRTRNAQVELYQSGDVDFLVATDAIGMGLNLNVDHVAFSGTRKFDGHAHRNLTTAELAQIGGRAGRHMNDGTFGVTGTAQPFSADMIEALESHSFEPIKLLQWRNRNLDYTSLDNLKASLRVAPDNSLMCRARDSDDVAVLESVSLDQDIKTLAVSPAAIKRLWEVCQTPDYRKISLSSHSELVVSLYHHLIGSYERIPEDWFAAQVARADNTDGDIDTLANRIAHIRTWTFASNRSDWLDRPDYWQDRTREIEDRLSDALHEKLTQRFVDRRTSVLMRRMRDSEELSAEITADGAIHVEKHFVGRLEGFCYVPDTTAEGIHGKASRNAAAQVLSKELAMRVRRVVACKDDAMSLTPNGRISWQNQEIGRIESSDDPLRPTVTFLADDHLSGPDCEKVQKRLDDWLNSRIDERLAPLVALAKADDISGLARGVSFRLCENFGILRRDLVANEVRELDQEARGQLRKYGVRFGAFNIYCPMLLKPAATELLLLLWSLSTATARETGTERQDHIPPRAGLTSVVTNPALSQAYYRAAGYHVCGPRAVRIDMLERLSDMIRPLTAWRDGNASNKGEKPDGATGNGGFIVQPEMMSILGCSAAELSEVLKSLGFRYERRPVTPSAPTTETTEIPETKTSPDNAPAAEDKNKTLAGEDAGQVTAPSETPEAISEAESKPAEKDGTAISPDIVEEPVSVIEPSVQDASGEASEDEKEVQYIEIWRPQRRVSRHKPKARSDTDAPAGRTAKGRADRTGKAPANKRKPAGSRPARPTSNANRKPRKVADPDSPFAALAKLKQELEKQSDNKPSS